MSDVAGAATDISPVLQQAAELDEELIAFRRHLHTHPELSWMEHGTSQLLADRLTKEGLTVRRTAPTGLVCDIGPSSAVPGRRRIGLRGDIDALPIQETTDLPFASMSPGISHSCGHDLHATAVLGAGLVLARLAERDELPIGVRLIFQPSEESRPSGAKHLVEAGVVEGVEQLYALHCAPRLQRGMIGSRIGPMTAATDTISVTISSSGGHTSRPHLTGDVVYALGHLITQLPAVLGRRLDARAAVNLTWGSVNAGQAPNAIPSSGTLSGTLRSLDVPTWKRAQALVPKLIDELSAPFAVEAECDYHRGMPPVDNDERCVRTIDAASKQVLGNDSIVLAERSLGGEDFAWYLAEVPGAMIRLGTRSPGASAQDLHQGDLQVDEQALGIAVRVLARTMQLAGNQPAPAAQQARR